MKQLLPFLIFLVSVPALAQATEAVTIQSSGDANPGAVVNSASLFNGANMVLKLNSSGQLPAVDGHLLTNVTASSIPVGGITGLGTGVSAGLVLATNAANGLVAVDSIGNVNSTNVAAPASSSFVFEGDSIPAGAYTTNPAINCYGYLFCQSSFALNREKTYSTIGTISGTSLTVSSSVGITQGQYITSANTTLGTVVTSISGNVVTMSIAGTSGASVPITFHNYAIAALPSSQVSTLVNRYVSAVKPFRPSANGGIGGYYSYLFVNIGINDIGNGSSASSLETALTNYIATAQADGFSVIVGTLLPRGDAAWQTSRTFETIRLAVNQYIRNDGIAGAKVIDLASSLPDVNQYYSVSGGYLHPNDIGHLIMSQYISTAMISGGSFIYNSTPTTIAEPLSARTISTFSLNITPNTYQGGPYYFYNGTGVVSCSGSTTAITGSGTSFTSEISPGDYFAVGGGNSGTVLSVTDNTHLTLFIPIGSFSSQSFTIYPKQFSSVGNGTATYIDANNTLNISQTVNKAGILIENPNASPFNFWGFLPTAAGGLFLQSNFGGAVLNLDAAAPNNSMHLTSTGATFAGTVTDSGGFTLASRAPVASPTFTGTVTTGTGGIVVTPVTGSTNGTVDFGANLGAPALRLYAGGAGSEYGWGIVSGAQEFYIPTASLFSFNGGGNLNASSGTNQFAFINSTGITSLGNIVSTGTITSNGGKILSLAGNFTTSGAFATTFTTTGTTTLTLPTSGTVATTTTSSLITVQTGTLVGGTATKTVPSGCHPWVADNATSLTNVGSLTVTVSGTTATITSTNVLDVSPFTLFNAGSQ